MIRVAQVKRIQPHPSSHSLKICGVWDGGQKVMVVCGASNVKEGMVTLLAGVGDSLPSGKVISEVLLRGVKSSGMLCSANDLGLTGESGIVNLPRELVLGTSWKEVDKSFLSSTPWHLYREVESYYLDQKNHKIVVVWEDGDQPRDLQLIAQSYYHGGEYHYRDILKGER